MTLTILAIKSIVTWLQWHACAKSITGKKQTGRQGGWPRICEDYSQNKQTKQLIN